MTEIVHRVTSTNIAQLLTWLTILLHVCDVIHAVSSLMRVLCRVQIDLTEIGKAQATSALQNTLCTEHVLFQLAACLKINGDDWR